MLRVFWQGIAALMGELSFPEMPDKVVVDRWRAYQVPDWSEIHAIAAQSYDEHDISLAFSASEEMKVYGDPLYRVVVARRLGLIGDYRNDGNDVDELPIALSKPGRCFAALRPMAPWRCAMTSASVSMAA